MDRTCIVCNTQIGNGRCYVGEDGATCIDCRYKEFVKKEIAGIHEKVDKFYQGRISEGDGMCDKDYLLSDLLEVMDKVEDKDIDAINYIIKNIKERF